MHSTNYDDDDLGTIVMHHNGDYSGNVQFDISTVAVRPVDYPLGDSRIEVQIPFEALQELVINKIRNAMISKLEQIEVKELVNLFESY